VSRRALRALGTIAWLLTAAGCGDGSDGHAVGTLERDRLELVAEASEPIVRHAVREGDRVEAGQLLVQLDATRFDALVAQAEAARDRALSRLAELERGPRRELVASARATLAGAEGSLASAREELRRSEHLVLTGVGSPARLDRDRAAHDEALARRDAARASLEALVEGTTHEELLQARAALAEAESALTEIRTRAARLEVRAPMAGRVDALPYETGERPPTGAPVAVLLAEGAPHARVYVPEALRVRVRPGVAARVHVDGADAPFAARVRSVSSEASFTPYAALTEQDRGRLVFVAEIDLEGEAAAELPAGVPVQVEFLFE
jgi:HlyD family secretion protein